ncbi:MAG: hypothetical protein PVG63_03340, partial [Anaerolineales bacterium]
ARKIPARYLVCWQGMDQCVLGVISKGVSGTPPCRGCTSLSRRLFPARHTTRLIGEQPAPELQEALEDLSIDQMMNFEWGGYPLGQICLPSVRWVLRRHTLQEDQVTGRLYQRYLMASASLLGPLKKTFELEQPRALVVFNGLTFPEATAREVASRMGIPVVTHEVGIRPFSAFFSHEEATFRQVMFGDDFQLGQAENERLDAYLSQRFKGRFSMAGVQFWPEMTALPDWLQQKIMQHEQMVAVFSNVIFDTSQVYANTLFRDMFAWLDDVLRVASAHPKTLFIIRAHPDEDRPGKASQESVAAWAEQRGITRHPNVVFFPPSEYVSSYDMMQTAKFTLVYNSSIGLEGTLMGRPVLAAGRSRYTQIPTVFYPADRKQYDQMLSSFLTDESLNVPDEFVQNARRFFYFEMFHASLDLSPFMDSYPYSRYDVVFKPFNPATAFQESRALNTIVDGILDQTPFYEGKP